MKDATSGMKEILKLFEGAFLRDSVSLVNLEPLQAFSSGS